MGTSPFSLDSRMTSLTELRQGHHSIFLQKAGQSSSLLYYPGTEEPICECCLCLDLLLRPYSVWPETVTPA
jgi:hypothetical protein